MAWLCLAGAGSAQAASPLPPQTLLFDGSTLTPEAWSERGLVVVFWASYCPFCARHNAKLAEQLTRFGAQAPIVLALSIDRDSAAARRYAQAYPYPFRFSLDSAAWRSALGVKATLPTTVAIRRSGRVGRPIPGEMFEEDLAELLQWAAAV
jgi:thiol-disulfide isomerase/thioredoxin